MKAKIIFIICLAAAAVVVFKLSLFALDSQLVSSRALLMISVCLMLIGISFATFLRSRTAK